MLWKNICTLSDFLLLKLSNDIVSYFIPTSNFLYEKKKFFFLCFEEDTGKDWSSREGHPLGSQKQINVQGGYIFLTAQVNKYKNSKSCFFIYWLCFLSVFQTWSTEGGLKGEPRALIYQLCLRTDHCVFHV